MPLSLNLKSLHQYAIILLLSTLTSACSLFSSRSASSSSGMNRAKIAPMIKDVDYQARGGAESVRKRVLLLPFLDNDPKRSHKIRDVALNVVHRELQRTRRFVIILKQELPQDISQYLTEENEYDLSELAKVANSLGMSAIVEGKILDINAKRVGDEVGLFRKIRARIHAKIQVRVISAKTGRMIWSEERQATVESETTRVAEYSFSDRFLREDPQLVRQAVLKAFYGALRGVSASIEKIHWEGRIAMVSGERVFVNAGRISGIQVGDILKVTEEGQEVFDPDRGTFIGNAPGRMKGTLEVVSYFGKDGAIAIVHSGSGFRENDRVELY